MAQLDHGALLDLLRELDRFERTSPGDPYALLDRCAALTRLQAPERGRACDEAATRAPPGLAVLVSRARALQAAP